MQTVAQLQKIPNFVIFQTPTGKINIEVFFENDTLWLSQKKMAELFEVNVPAISKHLKNIFESMGLTIDPACKDVCRLRFYSYDAEAYFNLNAKPFTGLMVNKGKAGVKTIVL